jgi:hypothetical protein
VVDEPGNDDAELRVTADGDPLPDRGFTHGDE